MRDKKSLGLLDDSATGFDPSEIEWRQITETAIEKQKPKPAPTAKPAPKLSTSQRLRQNAFPSKNLHTTPKGTRVFRNRPGLKQLMSEYNGRNSSLLPLKSAQDTKITTRLNARPGDFRYDSVEVMEVPSVKGKILRPS